MSSLLLTRFDKVVLFKQKQGRPEQIAEVERVNRKCAVCL